MTAKKTTTRKRATSKKKGPVKKAKQTAKQQPTGPKPNRVFAIRVTDAELAAIHKAAGPRNATRFIRACAAAFAAGDPAAFKAVLEEARKLRG